VTGMDSGLIAPTRIAGHASGWFRTRAGSTHRLQDSLRILIGHWICERGLGDAAATTESFAGRLANSVSVSMTDEVLKCEPGSLLLSLGILRTYNHHSDVLERSAAELVEAYSRHRVESINSLFDIRFLAHQLGLGPRPTDDAGDIAILESRVDPIWSSHDSVRRTVRAICRITEYGGRNLDERQTHPLLTVALPIWTIAYLREDNLELAASLMRCLSYLQLCTSPALSTAIIHLASQQRPDGGFQSGADPTLRVIGAVTDAEETVLRLNLSCLWALAEATNPDFVLLRSVHPTHAAAPRVTSATTRGKRT
jgi:hypothetical protein